MEIWNAFHLGVERVFRNMKMWLLLFGVQLVFAVILVVPLRSQLNRMLGYSLLGQDVLWGLGGHVFVEFLAHHAQTVSAEMILLFVVGLVYLTVAIFLNGGVLGIFVRKKEVFSARLFFGSAGQYFGRFVRLFFFSVGFLLIVLLVDRGLSALLGWISGDSEPLRVTLRLLRFLVFLFLIFLVQMVFDYAKIETVLEDRRRMLTTGLAAWGFVFRHFGETLGLYYGLGFVGLVFFVVYTVLGRFVGASTSIGIFVLFLWQQLYAFGRVGVRLLFFASQTVLYRTIAGEPLLKSWLKTGAIQEQV